jgi:hypothetical protein
MTFRANKNGTWVGGDDQSQGTVVYGKSGGNWLYAKSAWANKNGVWTRAWTDCRRHDVAGGRDWSTTTLSPVYSGSCGNQTYQIPTRYTKDGCPFYDVPGATVAAPNCNKYDTNCYNSATGAYEYRYSCTARESRIVYTFTPKSGTSCGTQYEYTSWVSDPDCGAVGGACWTNGTCNFINSTNFVFNGVFYTGVFDVDGVCYAYNESACWAQFWYCGANIGTTNFCF